MVISRSSRVHPIDIQHDGTLLQYYVCRYMYNYYIERKQNYSIK